jgi:tryptophan-rich sensory protein
MGLVIALVAYVIWTILFIMSLVVAHLAYAIGTTQRKMALVITLGALHVVLLAEDILGLVDVLQLLGNLITQLAILMVTIM